MGKIKCDERKVKIDQTASVKVKESEGQLRAAENNAKALEASAEGENKSTAGLEVKRKYELEWQRLEIMEKLAATGRRFISGNTGATIMKDMVPGEGSVTKKGGMF